MTIILDSDVLIEVFDKQSTKGTQIYKKIISSKDNIAITALTLYETLYGFLQYQKSYQHLLSFPVCEFSREDAYRAAQLEVSLAKQGKKIKRTDIMIASTVINRNGILYTFDKEFRVLENFGLKLFI